MTTLVLALAFLTFVIAANVWEFVRYQRWRKLQAELEAERDEWRKQQAPFYTPTYPPKAQSFSAWPFPGKKKP